MSDFPPHWNFTAIGDFASRVRRKNEGGACLDPMTISAVDGLVSQRDYFKKIVASKNTEGYTLLHKNDFAYNKSYSEGYPVGAARRLKSKDIGIVSPLYICFELDEIKIDLRFADYLFDSDWFIQAIYGIAKEGARSHGLLNIGIEEFFSASMPIPPLPEQKKIAEILSGIDRTISVKRQAKIDLEITREAICDELIQNGKWEEEKVGTLATHMTNGFVGTATPHYRERGIRYLTSKNIRRDRIDTRRMIYISQEFHDANQKSSLQIGDVLMVQSGHIGTTAVITDEYKDCNCHALILMRFNQNRVNPQYASLYFNSVIGKLRLSDIFVGSTVKHVNTGDLRKFKIPLPPLDIQTDIVSKIYSMDHLLNARDAQIQKLLSLKMGLSADLLSGRKRVGI